MTNLPNRIPSTFLKSNTLFAIPHTGTLQIPIQTCPDYLQSYAANQ